MNGSGLRRAERINIVLIYVLTCYSFHLTGQVNSVNSRQYTELDGLPSAEVGEVLVDRFGYIWAGTINGLARYDGYEFKRFLNNPNDPYSIKGLVVWSLYEDSKGMIWVGTSPSYLNRYDPATRAFRQFEFAHLIDHPDNVEVGISAICQDDSGRLYLGVSTNFQETIHGALLYKDAGDSAIRVFPVPDSIDILNTYLIKKDPAGNVWLISYNGVYRIDKDRNLTWMLNPEEATMRGFFPVDLQPGQDGHILMVSTRGDILDFDPMDQTYRIFKQPGLRPEYYFSRMVKDRNDNLWIGTMQGLNYFDKASKQFSLFSDQAKEFPANTMVRDLEFDDFGNLWVGTHRNGLYIFSGKPEFKSYTSSSPGAHALTSGWVNKIIESYDGTLWITTGGAVDVAGLNHLDLRSGLNQKLTFRDLGIPNEGITSIREAGPGELFIGTFNGLFNLSLRTKRIIPLHLKGLERIGPDAHQPIVHHFLEDKNKNSWLCTVHGVYKRTAGRDSFLRYNLMALPGGDASSNEVTGALESRKHQGLWLTTNNGLFFYDFKSGSIKRHGDGQAHRDRFISQDINSIYEDSSGITWVGTWQGGLARYDPDNKTIRNYTLDDGLPSMSIQGILGDEKNRALWLSTFEGLSRLDLDEERFYNYSLADGIQSQLFADGSYLKTSGGFMVFGGSNGITVFNPSDLMQKSVPPRVYLTDLKLFNRSLLPGGDSPLKKAIYEAKEVILNYNQTNLTLEFTGLHYANPSKNRYAYKMENYEDQWRDIGNQRVAFFPKLPSGQYVFRVKAANNNGVWNEEGASLKIIIRPPWWRTWTAYILYGLVLLAAGYGMFRLFRLRLIQKERERSQARELEQAREIEKAYNELGKAHESLKATQAQLIHSEKMASLGELTAGIAHEIQNPLNFVNNFSEVNSELIVEMNEEIQKSNYEEVKNIAKDISENEQKINYHGKRADAIVKSMLQHSRNASGQKEPTDLNALCDEYLRLSYHGLKAKDKTFQAEFSVDLDPDLPRVAVVPQEIGRVFLNLFNNAFYAVTAKCRALSGTKEYKPTVKVSTKWIQSAGGDLAEIRIEDNGQGIPEEIREKIFQPFYTTKPTGEGTGLGLSLAYDIVKAHHGEIQVDSRESEGSEFIIRLPAQ